LPFSDNPLSRRTLLKGIGLLAGLAPAWRHIASGQQAEKLGAGEKTAIAVIVTHIIPTDATPGAQEAGIANSVEAEAEKSDKLWKMYGSGLRELDTLSRTQFGKSFLEITYEQQDQLLRDIANSEFFKSVRNLTVRRFYNSQLGFESVGYPGMGQPNGHRDFDQPPSKSGDQHKGMELEAALPEGEGKKEVAASCGQCHRLDVVTSQRKTRAQWQQTVSKMITQYHASLEPRVADKIVAYLSQNLGSH
jgi:hypothetical protein